MVPIKRHEEAARWATIGAARRTANESISTSRGGDASFDVRRFDDERSVITTDDHLHLDLDNVTCRVKPASYEVRTTRAYTNKAIGTQPKTVCHTPQK